MKHPMQPIEWDGDIIRFKGNPIVQYLLDNSGITMNDLAYVAVHEPDLGITDDDQAQFAQLIGYSVSGWGDLSYVPHEDAEKADEIAAKLMAESDA